MDIPIGQKISAATETVEQPNKPPGWWSVDLSGSRLAVAERVSKLESIPRHWRGAIMEDIRTLDTQYNFVDLDAHYTIHDGMGTLHYSLTASTALV